MPKDICLRPNNVWKTDQRRIFQKSWLKFNFKFVLYRICKQIDKEILISYYFPSQWDKWICISFWFETNIANMSLLGHSVFVEGGPHRLQLVWVLLVSLLGLGQPPVVEGLSQTELAGRLDLAGPAELLGHRLWGLPPSTVSHCLPELDQQCAVFVLFVVLPAVLRTTSKHSYTTYLSRPEPSEVYFWNRV